ncbi:MAG: carboxypeptidase-like regulatory domain-containing protein, partial [Calditrichaeota bacterium]|nr:carboxypeptidase-like regulatory domain-containing protein [Calditrichota bacterium]
MVKRYSAKWVGRMMLALLFNTLLFAQTSTTEGKITGVVTDAATGEALIGANVVVTGTKLGASTDADGVFIIENVPVGTYEVSVFYVGYTTAQQTVTTNSGTVKVFFELSTDVLRFDEVVVTGSSGATSKRQLGNTISTISGENIAESRALDITGALSGKFAGVQVSQNSGDPAAGISVRLRSASTVNGSSDPLYIIDGVIVNNTSTDLLGVQSVVQNRLSDINPADIERIEVIKGGAAAAIYGSRASNGVVQIFTKKGQVGKPKITFSTSVNFNSLRKKIDYNQVPLDWENAGDVTNLNTVPAQRYDYQDMVFEGSAGTDNYLSVSGGVGNTTYFGSVSYLNNNGIMKNTAYDRSGIRLRVNQIIN